MSVPCIAVVGAGPAGATAALAIAEAGLPVTLIDDNPRAGGQIFRPDPLGRRGPVLPDARGERLRAAIAGTPLVTHLAGHQLVGATASRRLTIVPPEGAAATVDADALILASGAVEVFVPVPGWTLPGVFGLGALQILLKQSQLVPDRPVVLAGAGPLLYLTASQLIAAGATVAAVVDAAGRPGLRDLAGMAAMPALLRAGLGYVAAIRRAGVPILRRAAVAEIRGSGGVESARIVGLDRHWAPAHHERGTIACGAVGLGFGVRPNSEIAALIGCAHEFDPRANAWIVRRDDTLATSADGVYAIGDGAAIGGVENALAEGTIAAASVLRRLGHAVPASLAHAEADAARVRERAARFRAAMIGWSGIRSGIHALATPDTLVCRCEGITRAAIERAAEAGFSDLRSVKLHSRAGMGLCQGRVCGEATAHIVARAAGVAVADVGMPRARLPLRPVAFSAVLPPGS